MKLIVKEKSLGFFRPLLFFNIIIINNLSVIYLNLICFTPLQYARILEFLDFYCG